MTAEAVGNPSDENADELTRIRLARAGDAAAWAELFEPHRARLRRIIDLRLDRRVRGRIDPSDVVQEVAIEAVRLLPKYLETPEMPLFLWLRWLTGKTMQALHRRHLGVQAREVGREVRLDNWPMPEASSVAIAAQLVDKAYTPSRAAARSEQKLRLQQAIDSLDPIDREVLVLRHFEELTAEESARVLGIDRSAASKRYMRALKRLKAHIEAMPGGAGSFRL
ncbi:MAG: hypothetical protein ABS79_02620 [Planctomycetes bacterium SCN 63-9]|nr:MAG: hypothetical protein ABS79_02620 [Planctomycetes bacterium SCN 63-9]